eukprot:TRINITY_DN9882_c0_g1_i1.p1 TRINITY_DN9882_c0_g1~~TRINITY_DN9882_c0_g1_i1.p1  ORF type:complete len:180 (+),score=16.46 TRINITY_DN9882_c0_g1_i1:370-909(+)
MAESLCDATSSGFDLCSCLFGDIKKLRGIFIFLSLVFGVLNLINGFSFLDFDCTESCYNDGCDCDSDYYCSDDECAEQSFVGFIAYHMWVSAIQCFFQLILGLDEEYGDVSGYISSAYTLISSVLWTTQVFGESTARCDCSTYFQQNFIADRYVAYFTVIVGYITSIWGIVVFFCLPSK